MFASSSGKGSPQRFSFRSFVSVPVASTALRKTRSFPAKQATSLLSFFKRTRFCGRRPISYVTRSKHVSGRFLFWRHSNTVIWLKKCLYPDAPKGKRGYPHQSERRKSRSNFTKCFEFPVYLLGLWRGRGDIAYGGFREAVRLCRFCHRIFSVPVRELRQY